MSATAQMFAFKRTLPALCFCLAALAVAAAPQCSAATLYVSPSGNDNNAGTQAAPYQTIQATINNASTGDTVILTDGIYAGNGNRDLDFAGKNLTIKSQTGAANTIIDCGGTDADKHNAFRFHSKESSAAIIGLTMKNSARDASGAIDISDGNTVKVTDCTFTQNVVPGVFNNGTAALAGCTFTANTGSPDGGSSGCFTNNGTATLAGCTFSANTNSPNGGSVGCFINNKTATLTNCTFSGNAGSGGCFTGDGTSILTKCTFASNTGDGSSVSIGGTATLTGCSFTANTTQGIGGGGMSNVGTATLKNCIFANNTGGNGGAIQTVGTLTVLSCTFTSNTAFRGGAIQNDRMASLTNCVFTGNTAVHGGGVDNHYSFATVTLQYCSFFGNSAVAGKAPMPQKKGMKYDGGATLRYIGLLKTVDQEDNPTGGALDNDATITLTNCILWGNTAPYGSEIGISTTGNPMTTATHCDIQGGLSGTGNIKVDPLFVGPDSGDLHLQAGSPCIGAGIAIPGITTNRDGKPRSRALTIGAY